MHQFHKVPVLRHQANTSLPCCLEDLLVLGIAKSQVAERCCFDTVLGSEPAS